jgi:hypothetical protein
VLAIFGSGFWLWRSVKPLNSLVLTVHKLIALVAGIWLAVTVYRTHQAVPLGAGALLAVGVTAFAFLGAAATGGFLSTGKPTPPAILWVHRAASLLAAILVAVTLYLVLNRAG